MIAACSKDDTEYHPLRASQISNTILMSYTDTEGNDMLSLDNVRNSIVIQGQYNKRLPFSVIKLSDNEKCQNYISIVAELPDERSMFFNSDSTEAYGESRLNLTVGGETQMLKCRYRYVCTKMPDDEVYFGNSGIRIYSVEYNGITTKQEKFNHLYVPLICNISD